MFWIFWSFYVRSSIFLEFFIQKLLSAVIWTNVMQIDYGWLWLRDYPNHLFSCLQPFWHTDELAAPGHGSSLQSPSRGNINLDGTVLTPAAAARGTRPHHHRTRLLHAVRGIAGLLWQPQVTTNPEFSWLLFRYLSNFSNWKVFIYFRFWIFVHVGWKIGQIFAWRTKNCWL